MRSHSARDCSGGGSGLYRSERVGFGGFKFSGDAREGLDTSPHDFVRHKDIALPGVLRH